MPYLLMTRPQEASERFVAGLRDTLRMQMNVVISPLIGIEPAVAAVDTGDAAGLVFTSSNGVATAASLTKRRDLPCFCVGRATTKHALTEGWDARFSGADAETLIATLSRDRPAAPLLHLRGRHARGDIAARLAAAGLPARDLVVYDQPALSLNDTARAALSGSGPVIVPLFSPRSARQFASQHAGKAPLFLAAISDAVADIVKPMKYNELLIASQPDADSMAGLVETLVRYTGRVERGARAK